MITEHPSKAVQSGPHMRIPLNYVSKQLSARYAERLDPSTVEPYTYSKLAGTRTVRLMVLHPAWLFGSPLRCDLIDVKLGTQPFEALSYVWGSLKDQQPLLCHSKLLSITQNLDEALRFVRSTTKKRYLWVDAICINQQDEKEKETQIPLMRDIYSMSKRTLIWLGQADEDILSRFWVLRIMHPYTLFMTAYFSFMKRIGIWLPLEANIQLGPRMFQGHTDDLLRELFEREWFNRTWILQEILLNPSSIFLCGTHRVSAAILASYVHRMMPWFVYDPALEHQAVYRFQGQLLLQYFKTGARQSTQAETLLLLMVVQTAAITDPKDKVIGIQAILQQLGISLPAVSYSMSISQLYTLLTHSLMFHWQDLQLLSLASSSRVTPNLPSWVVDWNASPGEDEILADQYSRLTYLQCTDSVTKRSISASRKQILNTDAFSIDNELQLRGTAITKIRTWAKPSAVVHHFAPEGMTETEVDQERARLHVDEIKAIARWSAFLIDEIEQGHAATLLHQLASILNIGPKTFIDLRYQQEKLETDLRSIGALLNRNLDNATLLAKVKEQKLRRIPVWQALSLRIEAETLFTTIDGRLGLTYCSSVEAGDEIVLVAGSSLPFLLRLSHTKPSLYHFIAPAIVSSSSVPEKRKISEVAEGKKESAFEQLFRPKLPGDTSGKGSFKNYLVASDVERASVSGLMRGEEWPQHKQVEDMKLFTVV